MPPPNTRALCCRWWAWANTFQSIYDAFFLRNEGKPALPGYLRLLEALGVEGENCLFVEDSARNLRPAKELGMVTVLVDPPDGDVDGADYVIERISDIGRIVDKVGRVGVEA